MSGFHPGELLNTKPEDSQMLEYLPLSLRNATHAKGTTPDYSLLKLMILD